MNHKKETGVTTLYSSYLREVNKNRKKFAFLQLTGRIEDYMVKDFIFHIYSRSKESRYALTNIGNKGERRYDIAVFNSLKNDAKHKPVIKALIEAKYLRNWHRAWESNASDEISTTIKSLSSQLSQFKKLEHSYYTVKLTGHQNNVYGLIFASFVSNTHNDNKSKIFFDKIINKASEFELIYHDHKKPYLDRIYDSVQTTVAGESRFCTLKAGLWRKTKI